MNNDPFKVTEKKTLDWLLGTQGQIPSPAGDQGSACLHISQCTLYFPPLSFGGNHTADNSLQVSFGVMPIPEAAMCYLETHTHSPTSLYTSQCFIIKYVWQTKSNRFLTQGFSESLGGGYRKHDDLIRPQNLCPGASHSLLYPCV